MSPYSRLTPLALFLAAITACAEDESVEGGADAAQDAADAGGDSAGDTATTDVVNGDTTTTDVATTDTGATDTDAGGVDAEPDTVAVDTGADTATDAAADVAVDVATDDTSTAAATWAEVDELLADNCAACHYSQPEGLALVDAYDSLVNVAASQAPAMMRVAPGDPANSYLWRKLEGTHGDVGSGVRMPKVGSLTDDELATFRSWIEGGALP